MITIVSCGLSNGTPPVGDLTFDCQGMPDPSPVVHDLPGTAPEVFDLIVAANPMMPAVLDFLVGSAHALHCERENVGLVLVCSAGWHRSVAVAEEVARRLRHGGVDGVQVVHRDLVEAAT